MTTSCGCGCGGSGGPKKVIQVQIEGIQGPAGAAGAVGTTPDFSAEASTLAAGSDATAEAVQSADKLSVVLKLGIPRGQDGSEEIAIASLADIDNLFGV